jgi:thiol-disulfide isomerase/thioredoxin
MPVAAHQGFRTVSQANNDAGMRQFIASVLLLALTLPAQAETVLVRVLNFTADWCPNCRILEPNLDAALAAMPQGRAQRIDLDVTAFRTGTSQEASEALVDVKAKLAQAKADVLWEYYAGITGVVVLVAADTGEPLRCFSRLQDEAAMTAGLADAILRVTREVPGERYRPGTVPPDCP